METLDNKVQEVLPSLNTCKVEELTTVHKAKEAVPENSSVENGSVDAGKKPSGGSKEIPMKVTDENGQQPGSPAIKQMETTGGKQSNNKGGDSGKKSSREEKYSRRKDERSVEQIMRALNTYDSPQDKLDALVKKYAEVIDENRKMQLQTKNFERRLSQVEREKDTAQSEHSKAVLTRSRLEGLCRELQRQNKAIKEESLLRIREEEEKRKEVSNKFQSTLGEITSLMQQNSEKNSKLRDDNIEMTTKFKSVCEQYELRVQQVEKISKQMQLEAQLADAKLAKANLEAKAEKETVLRDKQELLMELAQYQARFREQQQVETELRNQVELYTNKYDEFQTALSRSNEVFGGFKEEMDRMSKKIVKLEKETSTWKLRWEKSHQALLEMAADKQQRDAELSLANRQLTQLHKLCRTLTEERAKLMAQINSVGATTDTTKEEKLASEIAEDRRKLNDTLDSLQSVILERELLQKQQQLEKQQQQLQVELQKHITAAVSGEPTGKQGDTKAPDPKSDSMKTKDSKESDVKASGGKNADGNRKKGKKQKCGRQVVGKQENSGESKQEESKDVKTTSSDDSSQNDVPPETKVPSSDIPAALEEKCAVACESSGKLSDSSAVSAVDEVRVEKKKETNVECATVVSPVSPNTEQTATQTPIADSASAPAPSVFSYAAAVGSKPAEHSLADKSQKTEEKAVDSNVLPAAEVKPSDPKAQPEIEESDGGLKTEEASDSKAQVVISESGLPQSSSSIETSSNAESLNGGVKSIVDEKHILAGEAPTISPPSVTPPKKGKKRVGQPMGIKGRTMSLFRISKPFGCLKCRGHHDSSSD